MENMSMKEILENNDSEDFQKPKKNQRRKGEVVVVRDDCVVVNLHYKSDGILPAEEVANPDDKPLSELFHPGDEIEVLVLKPETKEGDVLISSKKVKSRKDWEKLEEAYNNGETIKVKVTGVVKGGLSVYYNNIRAFIPASHIDIGFVKDLKQFVGQEIEVEFLDFDRRRNQVVLSRKAIVEREQKEELDAFWSKLAEGQIVNGIIRRFTSYGAFVEIGPTDGLLHVSEIQWGKVAKPSDVLKLNDEMEFMIIGINREDGKISLSRKQLSPDPWMVVLDNYQEGERYDGKVVSLTEFGAFIELEPGLEGLVHVSQISEDRVELPQDVLELGEEVVVKIVEIDTDEKRIKLTMKE